MLQTSRSFLQVQIGCNQASSFDCFYTSVDNDNGSSLAAHLWCPDSTKLLEFFSHVILNCKNAQVKASFRPEFVNRVDEFVVFEALKLNEIRQIVRLQAKRVEQRLAEKKIKLELDESAVDYLAVRVPSLTFFLR